MRGLRLLLLAAFFLHAACGGLWACTLWAASGKGTSHGGSLLAKNRDWFPEPQEVKLAAPPGGYRFLGLFPLRPGKTPAPVAGVNSRGLAVVTASAGSLPRPQRHGGRGMTGQLLSRFASVEEVLANAAVFAGSRPVFYLLADRARIAWIEVAPQGGYAIRAVQEGVLAHTNHYLAQSLGGWNSAVGRSSRVRLARIGALLADHRGPFKAEDFLVFGKDTSDGPDNSLWRTGSRSAGKRTLAFFVCSLPPEGTPELWLEILAPDGEKRTGRWSLSDDFWEKRPGRVF